MEYVDAGSVLISTMDSSGKKKKFLLVSKKMMLPMLPKTSVYVKIMMIKLKGWIFWLNMICWKNIMAFVIKSTIALQKNLIANLSTINIFWKPN